MRREQGAWVTMVVLVGSPSVDKAPEQHPKRIGRYTVMRRLARGGMAELFLVRAEGVGGFQKIVVLKRILPNFAGDPDFIEMFLNEARNAAALAHPNVATVYDIGRHGDDYFFTMEYIHGEDLRALLKAVRRSKERIPLSHVVSTGIGIAAGIHHAHSRIGYDGKPLGLVHRDISPTNVLVTYDGAVKVVDFGIAKAATSSHVTSEGTRKGKVAYMSPEQVRAEDLDHRSDLFAIGILLYEMCTGKQLFGAQNEFASMRRILEGEIAPPSKLRPDLPPGLDDIMLRALARDPNDRFASALELQLSLEGLARDERLASSAGALGQYVRDLMGDKPYPWEGLDGLGEVQHADDGSYVSTMAQAATKPREALSVLPPTTAVVPPRRRGLAIGLSLAAAAAVVGFVVVGIDRSQPRSPEQAPPDHAPPEAPSGQATRVETAPIPTVAPTAPTGPESSVDARDIHASGDPPPPPPAKAPVTVAKDAPSPTKPKPKPKRPRRKRPKAEPTSTPTKSAGPSKDPDWNKVFGF